MLQYYTLDVECTGLKKSWHEINQISVIRHHDGAIATKRIAVKHPERAAPQALEVQGITVEDLKQGEPREVVLDYIHDFLQEDDTSPEHRCIIGHNVALDRRFCWAEWDIVRKVFPAHLWLCTKSMGHAFVKKTDPLKIAAAQRQIDFRVKPNKPKFGLNILMKGLGIEPEAGAHDAVVDTINTKKLFEFFMESKKIDHVSLIKRLPHKAENAEQDLDIEDF